MLENLTERLSRVVKNLRGQARLTDDNIQDALREVRLALLEADVALPVVREFVAHVKEKAVGEEVVGSLTPGQALIGVVHRELTALMGGAAVPLSFATQPPAVDPARRPAGRGQDDDRGQARAPARARTRRRRCCWSPPTCIVPRRSSSCACWPSRSASTSSRPTRSQQPVTIARARRLGAHALPRRADRRHRGPPGRGRGDDAGDRRSCTPRCSPIETLFVVDAMQGQDAVNTAKAFRDALPLTGVVLTKLDGDARGGAALSVRHVTGAPIKFAGVAEKINGLEVFHPERMASRILGMGDVLSLIEDAQKNVDVAEAQKLAKKVKSGKGFDLTDFKAQIGQMRKMGGIAGLMDKLPAELARAAQGASVDERRIARIEGIINSMTPAERAKPEILKASRKRRIAAGAGVTVQEVNQLLNQFEQTQKMMKMVAKGGMQKMLRGMKGMLPGMR